MEAVVEASLKVVGMATTICAGVLVLAIPLGGVEGQLGEMFQIPGLRASMQMRIMLAIVSLVVAVSAVPLSNAITEALFS